ncbi:MAG: cyclic nucleotide-binding/CBS domain-containing protein [Candidatus Hodarchaeota archaeon]
MLICPSCGFENLPGSAVCENCNNDIIIEPKIITDSRIEKAVLEDKLKELAVEQTIAIQVPPEMPVREVVQLMIKNQKCSVVIIGPEGTIDGIFTERSLILRVCNKFPIDLDKPIKEAMLSKPIILKKNDCVAHALHMMFAGGYTYAIIDDDPVRVINIRDILIYLVELHPSLGGLDKVLNILKTAALKINSITTKDQSILNHVKKNQEIFYKAFTAARQEGKIGETERINPKTFLTRFVPAVRDIAYKAKYVSPDEAELLNKLTIMFEEKKDEFLSVIQSD